MSKISRRGLRITAAAAGAGVIAAAALANTAHAGTRATLATTDSSVRLSAMPQGTLTLGLNGKGELDLTVSAFGLTPGSSHKVELMNGRKVITTFSMLTANSAGQAKDKTLDSSFTGTLGSWQVALLNGNGSASATDMQIARTATFKGGQSTYRLIPVETTEAGKNWGTPQGSAVVAYNQKAKTISVTVNASGFQPGRHAVQIRVGTCAAQGPVQYTLKDFTANAKGHIVKETRVVTGATTPLPATGWYLNLHQGTSSNITLNGRPTINFRPLLCGDIVTKR